MYQLTWITNQLAAGYAPMSYKDLEDIKKAGIVAIVNLCAEFTDLHEIEEKAGFEVYYLPVPDESAPSMEAMEKALEWLDEAIYLNKKVLIHCRHGHGRTGTLVSAYLVRKGLGLKRAEKILKNTRANPTNYSQWKLLKKYLKKEGVLAVTEPRIEFATTVDLSPFFTEYEAFADELREELEACEHEEDCGGRSEKCCRELFRLQLAEAIYLHSRINASFSQDERHRVRDRALEYEGVLRTVQTLQRNYRPLRGEKLEDLFSATETLCPLAEEGRCTAYEFRPFRCQWYASRLPQHRQEEFEAMLASLSQNIFLALTGSFFPEEQALTFSVAETVSGRYVQTCFMAMTRQLTGQNQ